MKPKSCALHTKNRTRGIATLELLIAMAIGVVFISGATIISFGAQTAGLDTALTNTGLYKMVSQVEDAIASTTADWSAVATPWRSDSFYSETNTLSDISPCIKHVASGNSWQSENYRGQGIGLRTLVANVAEAVALGGDCDPIPPGEWDDPASLVTTNISGQSDATDIDANGDFVYLVTNPNASNKKDFFIFEFDSVAVMLTQRGELDIDIDGAEGLLAVDVAGNYAYAASASTTAQFMVIDVSNPVNPILTAKWQLAGVDPFGSFPQGISVYYRNGRVYIGTRETAGPELHVFDVSDPNPANWAEIGGGLELTTSVYDIFVHGDYAYLATSDNQSELCIVNVSDLTDPLLFRDCEDVPGATNMKFNTSSDQNGGGIYVLGDRVYLGLSRGQFDAAPPHDFYVLNIADQANVTLFDSANLGISGNTDNEGIVVRGNIAFIALDNPTNGLQVWNVLDPFDIKLQSTCSALNFAENTTGIDMDSNFVFLSNGSNAEIRVIYDQSTTCPL
ncbi:hypothetical protein A3A35_03095 [Candidatus Kaiserbacteria bacterium RIFCSPLOWO2_01_FULL_51_21]|uniref:Cadherin domain-containing protein n=1 Tax=Candidatus Kaiserbacteria bacterium RIFCSPLOWO2_01_FULL_51_21 TaxID=1798508 RepID=A0A1F6ECU7_9BACT|nr:MAG: hypothetical protein A3A35_03095 [Candidatus Kaiserbacteria bacterium RIFCSPLOWO2_01_FULL_51_21]